MEQGEYPIRAVSRQTGLSIDTLRAWERRYGAVVPARTERGRVYTEADIDRLQLLRRCTEAGFAIGQIAGWDNDRLKQALSGSGEPPEMEDSESALERLIATIKIFDSAALDKELARLAIFYPPGQFVKEIALPFMHAVGEQWHSGKLTIAQEHLASSALRNVLGSLMRYYLRGDADPVLLFATPKGEQHEFGILGAAMLAVSGGLDVLYLGLNLPADEILQTAREVSPKVVVLGWKAADGARESLAEIKRLARELPRKVELWIGGVDSEKIQKDLAKTRSIVIINFDELETHLTRFGWRG